MKTLTIYEGRKQILSIAIKDFTMDGKNVLAEVDFEGASRHAARVVNGKKKRNYKTRIGTALTREDIKHMRWIFQTYPPKDDKPIGEYFAKVGKLFGVSMFTPRDVYRGTTWARVRAKKVEGKPVPKPGSLYA